MSTHTHDGGSVPNAVRICPECGSPIPTAQPAAGIATPTNTSSATDTTPTLTETATVVTQDSQGDTEEGGVQDVTTGDVISSVDEGVAREVESPTDRADSRGTSFFVPDDSKSIDKGANESLGEGQEDEGPPLSEAVTQETRFNPTHEVAFSQSQEDDYQAQLNPQSQGPHPRGQDAQQGPYATYAQPQGQDAQQGPYATYAQPQGQDARQGPYATYAQPQGQTYDQPGASTTQAYPQQPTSYTQVQVFTQPPYSTRPVSRKSRVAAGLLAIFCGILGFHKFYLGYISAGIIMFLLTFFLWWTIVVPLAMFLVSIIEGVMYLTKSDEEFQRIYVQSQKDWF